MSPLKTDSVSYQDQKPDFGPVQSITTESLPATPLVYAAYGTVWVVLVLYVFVLAIKLSRVERDLKDVTARLAKRG
jgi:CcmD family protein